MQSEAGLDFAGRAAEINSLLSQAKLELNEAESARTAAKKQLDMLRTQGQAVQGIDIQTPEIDIRLNKQQSNLDTLLQRFTENHPDVVNTRRLESTSNVADFRVIDPPRVNPKPVAPNRILLLPLALLISLGAGAGAAFLLSQMRPVFFDGASLRQATQMPLLGVIELIPTQNLRNRELKSFKRFVVALAGLICIYAGGMALLSYQSRILG